MALLWKEPEQVDVVWRAARAAYDLSQAAGTPKARQKELLEQALKLIRDAKNKERNDGAIYRWSGIILSAAGAFQGTTEYIKNAFVVRDDWEQATFINSYDATAVHLLGRWHFDVANMSWLTRKAASTFFAEPPSATFAEALEYFMRAESLNPGFWKANQYMLAQTHAKMGNKEEAVKWALSAIRLPVLSEEDAKTHAEVEAMLKATDSAAWATWQAEKAKREELRQAAVSAEAHRLGAGVPRK
ncbi:MAG: hypothetical protein EOP49_04940 [Sphingobacteriales bacterium]|nr:MAG: hypothetical protein EOP49_04940 [Sphingobacteriales bacterium]